MASFELVKTDLLEAEGGYVNDPDDPGGETNFGISKRSYPHLDIRNLTFAAACSIYQRDYWIKYRLDEINSQLIANKLFLAYINTTPAAVTICLQCAINATLAGKIDTDGILGDMTIRQANAANQGWLLDRLRVELITGYLDLIRQSPWRVKYLGGWQRRALK